MQLFLLVWNHKHGTDYNCFSSEQLAYEYALKTMRYTLSEWTCDSGRYKNLSEEELWSSWTEIWEDESGEVEYFEIIQLPIDPKMV